MNKPLSHASGFTLFEIIIALFMISLAIVPMLNSFVPAMTASAHVEKTAVMTNQARATMERLLALDVFTLKAKADETQPLSGSAVFGDSDETFTFEGIAFSPEIFITNVSGHARKTLLGLSVTLGEISITTRKADF